jgi:hypothetical protein
MTVIVVMAIFGLVTGFSTVRVGYSLPISIVRDVRLKGLAAGSVMSLIGVIGLALVWSLMKEGVRQWTLSYVLAYVAGMLAASYKESRQERGLGHGAARSGVAADRSCSKAPRRGVAPHRPVVSPGDGVRPDRGAIGHADVHGRISRSDDMAATVAMPCMWSKVFWSGS